MTRDAAAEDGGRWESVGDLREALLAWYDRDKRDLPWRGISDPYKTWVSEVMLQQTQVATVIDYYKRWLERFPTVEDLASAPREEVMELWAGLGYYRRARFLHESAGVVVEEFGGRLPRTPKELRRLKGVGRYTAGAIASIAFGEVVPVVDGNVERVLSRLRAIGGDPKSKVNQERYWELAGELVDPERPGDFNQSLMELGATICTPTSPSCMLCPVRERCEGFGTGEPEVFPDKVKRARQRSVEVVTCVLGREQAGERVYLVLRRPADGLLGGLWEFPSVELAGERGSIGRAMDGYLGDMGVVTQGEARGVGEVVHHFSHLRMTLHVEERDAQGDGELDAGGRAHRWLAAEGLAKLPMSAAMRKVWDLRVRGGG